MLGQKTNLLDLLLTNYDDLITNIVYIPFFGKSDHIYISFDLKLSYTFKKNID